MARRRKQKKKKQKATRARQKMNRPAARLSEARAAATQGKFADALELAQGALHAANDDATIQRSRALTAELHFRLACQGPTLQERLHHLTQGQAVAPEDRRFPLYRALVLLVLQEPEAAQQALMQAQKIVPADPEATALLAFARTLADPTAMPEATPEKLAPTLDLLTAVGRGGLAKDALTEEALALLPGSDPDMWRSLLTMAADPKSSLLTGLQKGPAAKSGPLAEPLLDYYAGVAALRRNDHGATVAAWLSAQASGLETPWFQHNRTYLLRQAAEELAEQEAWSDVVKLLQYERLATEDVGLKELLGYGYFHLGTMEAEAAHWPQAAEYWRRANALTPSRNLAQNLALAEERNENWLAAAQAWREMVRRRPRKASHPDYLDDNQVAMVWKRAGNCYEQAYDTAEAITCLTKAIDYQPENLAWRMELVKDYFYEERNDAAENELHRILEVDARYLPALIELAEYYVDHWDRDAMPIWRRAVAADATNETARDGLAHALIAQATYRRSSPFGNLLGSRTNATVKELEKALNELPDHPLVLTALGHALVDQGKKAKGRERMVEAGRLAGRRPGANLDLLGEIMHELLHADGDEEVAELIDLIRPTPTLRGLYWIDQADRVLHCHLEQAWADRFYQEALDLSLRRPEPDTPAYMLLRIIGSLDDQEEVDEQWMQAYIDRIDVIAPDSGLREYAEALQIRHEDVNKSVRLLRRSKDRAQAAGEAEIVDYIEMIEMLTSGPAAGLLSMLEGLDPDELATLMDSLGDDGPGSLLDIFK